MAIWIPRDYQGAIRAFGLETERFNLWAGTGTGKTAAGISLFDHRRMFGEAERMLVVTTKRVARQVWPKEIRKWENFHHLSYAVAIGTADERTAALRQGAQITTINFDNLPWLIDKIGIDNWPFGMVIADESSKLKSLRIDMRKSSLGKVFMRKSGGGERAMKIARVAHTKTRFWVNATGTPASNGLIDLWGQSWYVDSGARLGRTFSSYKERWFNVIQQDYGTIVRPKEHAEAEIKARLADVCITIEARDYFDLPPTVYNKVSVTLPPDAYRQYLEMEKEMFTEIAEFGIEAVNSGAKSMKCRQIASGAAYIKPNSDEWVSVHDAKIEALHDIIADLAGEPIIVAYQFKSDLARLLAAFPQGRYFDDSDATLQAFVRGEIPVLFAHPASAAHGIDEMQQNCCNIAFFSQTWNLEEFQQIIERIGSTRQAQSGFYRTVYVHLIIAEGTVEEDMVKRIETKASVQDAIKAAGKKHDSKIVFNL